jgi:hypothetical protein
MVRVGDVLLVRAAGGLVRTGENVLETLGTFVPAILGTDNSILSPAGAPNTILYRAREAGDALVELVTGDPFYSPHRNHVAITVVE